MIGIGIDTGGTCTDTVVYDLNKKQVLGFAKAQTTHERLEVGIADSLRQIPRDLIEAASYISLSTTLATNAAVEHKGGRVCLIFIGVDQKTVEESYQNYGFDGTDFMYFIEGDAMKGKEPNWQEVRNQLPSMLEGYDGVAISQVFARKNNGAYEKQLKEIIEESYELPVVCAFEIFKDLNAVKRGAGALLNAQLIPVINEFFDAVEKVLKKEQIHLPFVIMKSDGSLVSADYSRKYPVETLLCGPTASAKGGSELFVKEDSKIHNAIIIDMGGTTSDIAMIKNGQLLLDEEGVKVGNWQTFVKGIAIDTFALGGDSRIYYKNNQLLLGDRRVHPISLLAKDYPQILEGLKKCNEKEKGSARPLHEHFLLLNGDKVKSSPENYTENERGICQALSQGPLSLLELASRVSKDAFSLKTQRLEDEGIILRAGFTPTDAMAIKGDFEMEEGSVAAARLALEFMARSMGIYETCDYETKLCNWAYYLVEERLYCNLVRILWTDSKEEAADQEELEMITQLAKVRFKKEQSKMLEEEFFQNIFATDAYLLGVGAPTHIFLQDVAKALHTKGLSSPYSGVSNALGALLGDVCAYETIYIRVDNQISAWDEEGEEFVIEGDRLRFDNLEEAIEKATALARERSKESALKSGANKVYDIKVEVKQLTGATNNGEISLGAKVIACAKGSLDFSKES